MSPLHRSVSTSADVWARLESIIEEFEEAWLAGAQPDIDDFLSADEPARDTLLLELVHADLECRLKKGLQAHVETYVERYPRLSQARPQVLELIATEFNLRRRQEPTLSAEEFLRRFPQYREDLAPRLASPPDPPAAPPPGRLDCPDCGQTIEVTGDTTSGDFTCPKCRRTLRIDPEHFRAGFVPHVTRLGKFVLEAVAGKGAFGTVYRAEDSELHRTVAVKVPRDPLTTEAERTRFFREARTAAKLTHPGIVPIYEVNQAADSPYIVSGFVEGQTLAEATKDRRLPPPQVAGIVAEVAEAVDYAHQQKVIHRDLKPTNIMLGRLVSSGESAPANGSSPSRPIVMDFGLARLDDGAVRLTVEGQVLGTPAYMSPEQAIGQGHQAAERSDVYSLGVILYELLTGEVPFRGTPHMVLHQIRYAEPRPPRELNDKIPRDLETIVLKCLEKSPGRRYPTAGTLAKEMRRYLEGRPIEARPVGRLERAWRWARRNPWQTAALFLLVVLAVGSTAAAFYIHGQRQIAVEAQGIAEKMSAIAGEERDKAAEERDTARRAASVTNAQLNLSLDTMRLVFHHLDGFLQDRPGTGQLRQQLLKVTQSGLKKVVQIEDKTGIRYSSAVVHNKVGELYLMLGRVQEAQAEFEEAHRLAMLATQGESPYGRAVAEQSLALACSRLGDVALHRGKVDEALKWSRKALDQALQWTPEMLRDPVAHRYLTLFHTRMADVLRRFGKVSEARDHYLQALALAQKRLPPTSREPEPYIDAALIRVKLGDVVQQLGDLPGGRAHWRDALGLYAAALAIDPKSVDARRLMAGAYQTYGENRLRRGEFADAWENLATAADHLERLTAADPRSILARDNLAQVNQLLGEVLMRLGEVDASLECYRKARTVQEQLETENPENKAIVRSLSITYERLAYLTRLMGQEQQARELYSRALKRREHLATLAPKDVGAQIDLAAACSNLGDAELQWLNFAQASKCFERGREIVERLDKAGIFKQQPRYQSLGATFREKCALAQAAPQALQDLKSALAQPPALVPNLLALRGRGLALRGEHEEAVRTAEVLRRGVAKNGSSLFRVACIYALCSTPVREEPETGAALLPDEATRNKYRQQALTALAEAVQNGFKDVAELLLDHALASLRSEEAYLNLKRQLLRQVRERQ